MTAKRIVVLTGIRSEYDILYGAMRAITAHPELELQVVVAGAHLAPQFGLTVRDVEADGFPVAERIESLLDSNTAAGRIKSAAIELLGLVPTLQRLQPDFLLVCGDREEAIIAALAGAYMNIAVAHIAGGDIVVGNVDDSVRHAVTKLAHLHFPLSRESAQRIERMGEEAWRVTCSGNPGLDRFRLVPRLQRAQLAAALGCELDQRPLLLVIQHNISSEIDAAGAQMHSTLQAVAELDCIALVGYPNSDAGSRDIIAVIDAFCAQYPNLHSYRNLPRQQFLSLLQEADVLVGNSSLGLLEAPFLKLPAINIGNRQKQRQHADNLLFVPHDVLAIQTAIHTALHDVQFRQRVAASDCPFGDGHAGERIAQVLAATPVDQRLLVKHWAY